MDLVKEIENCGQGLIVLASRPGKGNSKTCCELFKEFSKIYECLYFDLSGYETSYWLGKNEQVLAQKFSDKELKDKIEKFASESEKSKKIIFVDYLQLINDLGLFVERLERLSRQYSITIIATSQLPRKKKFLEDELAELKDLEHYNIPIHYISKLIHIKQNEETNNFEYYKTK